MTIEAIKKEIASLKAQIREINGTLDYWNNRLYEDVQIEWLMEERSECCRQLEHYKKMLKVAEERL